MLNEKEVEKILKNLISDSHGIKRATIEQDIKYALNQLCKLQPKNQVIAEGEVNQFYDCENCKYAKEKNKGKKNKDDNRKNKR